MTIHSHKARLGLRALALGAVSGCAMLGLATQASAQTAAASPLSPLGQELNAKGISLSASYFGEFAANPSGGAKQGSDYADQVFVGADIDLDKLAALPGGALHINFSNRDGSDLANDRINNSVAVQQIYGGGQTYYLTTFTYEQKLFGNLLDLEGGRTELDQVALHDPIYCHFQSNAICGQPDIMGKLINSSFWPVPVWAGRAILAPTRDTYIVGGVFDSNSAESQPGHHGFDLSVSHSQGELFPLEFDYQTSFDDDAYPRRYDAGIVFDRTPYTYTVYDAASKSLGNADGYGRSMIYFQAKQMVYRPSMSSQSGLDLFGAVVVGPDSTQPADYNISGGAVYQGPFDRPLDSYGVMVGDTHYRNRFLNALYDYRVNALGGTQHPASDLVMAEIDYDAFITPWLDVMPNLQYIMNPDSLSGQQAYTARNVPDAFVIGVQFNLNLSNLVGLSS